MAGHFIRRFAKPWRVLLINVPHTAIGSRMAAGDHLPPLGLLAVGGPLLDDGHHVRLVDAELGPMSVEAVVAEALAFAPNAILFGHSGIEHGTPDYRGMEPATACRAAAGVDDLRRRFSHLPLA